MLLRGELNLHSLISLYDLKLWVTFLLGSQALKFPFFFSGHSAHFSSSFYILNVGAFPRTGQVIDSLSSLAIILSYLMASTTTINGLALMPPHTDNTSIVALLSTVVITTLSHQHIPIR